MGLLLRNFVMIITYRLTECDFTVNPPDGNHLEFHPLILQWHHNFDDIRGCMWIYAQDERSPYVLIIRYGTSEGLEVRQLGWELTNIDQPCSGGIQKMISSLGDAGIYELRIVAGGKITPSESVIVKMIKSTDRSINVTSHKGTTVLLLKRDINRTVVIEDFANVSIRINDNYPDSSCMKIQMFRGEHLKRVVNVCDKTFDFDGLADVDLTYFNISVSLDIVNFTSFDFSILLKDKNEGKHTTACQDTLSSSPRMSSAALISVNTAVTLGVVMVGVVVVIFLIVRMKRKAESSTTASTASTELSTMSSKYKENDKVYSEIVPLLEKNIKPKWTRDVAVLDFEIIDSGGVILASSIALVMLNANGEVMDMQITPDVQSATKIAMNNKTGDIVVCGTSRNLFEELHVYSHEKKEWKLQNRFEMKYKNIDHMKESAVNCVTWTITNDILVSETGIWQTKERSNLYRYTAKGETVWRREIDHVVTDITVDNKDNIYCCAGKRGFYVFNADGLSTSVFILDVPQSIKHVPLSFCFNSKERVVVLHWDFMRNTGVVNLFDKNGMFIKNVGKVNSIDTVQSKIRFWNDSTMYVSNMKGIMAFDVNLEKTK